MSTRGAYGFVFKNNYYVQWCSEDAYPGGLGEDVYIFINECVAWDKIKYNLLQFNNIYLSANGWSPLNNLRRFIEDNFQHNSALVHDNPLISSLFCEYGYLINLDLNCLDLYRGFQHLPQLNNPLGSSPAKNKYYPCKLVASIPLKEVSRNKIIRCFQAGDLIKDAYELLQYKAPEMPNLDHIEFKNINTLQEVVSYLK